MGWIRTGRKIGQAVKNAQRLRQIVAVLVKHGFGDIVYRMNLGKFLPSRLATYVEAGSEATIAERLRHAFEELGPTFVKLGQLLSTRSDLLPENFIQEFTQLQDNVLPLPFETVKEVVERELKKPLGECYASFDPKPLAAASIGQVHLAMLHSGEKVVVKVQRPDIERVVDTDVSLLAFLAGLLERYIPETRVLGPTVVVDEFFRTLGYELDFAVEANNMVRIAENMKSIPDIVIPKLYTELCTHRVLTQERFEGIRVNDLKGLEAAGIDRKAIVKLGARAFFKAVFLDGIFHGDLHGGNLFVLPGNKLGMIDFGIVGRLSERSRTQLANMVMSLITEDFENLCYQYAELGAAGPSVDFDGFQRDVRNTIAPYMGLSMKQVNTGKVLIEATRIATRYNIKVPGDWMLVFKAILTMEGMGKSLDPDFDALEMGKDLVKDLIKDQYSVHRLSRDFLWIAKDVAALLQVLPRQVRWMLRKFNSNDFAFEIKSPDLQEIRGQLDVNGRRQSLSLLAAGAFVAGSIALHAQEDLHRIWGYPVIAVLLLGIGMFLLVRLLFGKFRP